MLKLFFKDGVVYTLPKLVQHGLTLILLPVYTRFISPEDYGSLDLFFVFVGLLQIVITLEIQQGLARFFGTAMADEQKNYAFTSLAFIVFVYSICALVLYLWEEPLAQIILQQENRLVSFRLGIAYIWVNGILQLFLALFRWELRSYEYCVILLVNAVTGAVAGVVFVAILSFGLNGLLLSMLIAATISCFLACLRLTGTLKGRFVVGRLIEMISFSTPLVISGLALVSCLYIDRIMLQFFEGLEAVGNYGVAYRIAMVGGLAVSGFQGALMPLVYKHHESSETPNQLAALFRLFIGGTLLLVLFAEIFSAEILSLLAAPRFQTAGNAFVFLLPAIILSRLYIFAPGISLKKKTMLFVFINTAGALCNIALNLLFIPTLGVTGAALASLITFLLLFISHMYFSQRYYPVPHDWRNLLVACFLIGGISAIGKLVPLGTSELQLSFKILMLLLGAMILLRLKVFKIPDWKINR